MPDTPNVLHLAVGVAAVTAGAARGLVRSLVRIPGLRSPIATLTDRGDRTIATATTLADAILRATIVKIVAAALDEIDLTRLIRENVDIDAIVEGVDLDLAVSRVDLDLAVSRVDLDLAVSRVDLDLAVSRVDLDLAVSRVDLDKAIARVDIDAVIGRVDLDAVVDTVNLDRQVSRVDLDTAISRVDLIALANFVIDGVDLPDIIRDSTGSLSAEAVRGVRSQGMNADDAVSHFVGRLFGREPGQAPT